MARPPSQGRKRKLSSAAPNTATIALVRAMKAIGRMKRWVSGSVSSITAHWASSFQSASVEPNKRPRQRSQIPNTTTAPVNQRSARSPGVASAGPCAKSNQRLGT